MSRITRTMMSFALALLLVGCAPKPAVRSGESKPGAGGPTASDNTPTVPATRPEPTAGNERLGVPAQPIAVSQGAARLGFDLLARLAGQDRSSNILVSPVSIDLALGMTWNGAAGSTDKAMAEVLGFAQGSRARVNAGFRELAGQLRSTDSAVQLDVANSLWARKGIQFLPAFLERNRDNFSAEISDLNFDSPEAVGRINDWVSKSTKGKITRIINEIGQLDILFLINAVYFKGLWTYPFDKAVPGPFTTADGKTRQVPMMSKSQRFPYLQGPGFQAAAIPYGEERVRFFAFLPDSGGSLDSLTAQLRFQDWNELARMFVAKSGTVTMPVFKFEYEANLNAALSAQGMAVAFDRNQADFSRMCRSTINPPFISEVLHKTFIEVNEKGTEAAAVTSVRIPLGSLQPPEDRFALVFDRPFLLAIYDTAADALLFLGIVRDPKAG